MLATAATLQSQAPPLPGVSLLPLLPIDAPLRDPAGLALRVELLHPADAAADDADVPSTPWRLAPDGGWLTAVAIDVTGPDGAACAWPLRASAARGEEPLQLEAGETAWVVFHWHGQGPRVAPGRHRLQARLQCDSGSGFRGRASSEPLEVVIGGEFADVSCAGIGGPVRGVPFVVDVQVAATGPRLSCPRDLDELAAALRLEVAGADGKALAWPFRPPVMPWSDRTWLAPGEAPLAATFGLSAAATAALPLGPVTLVATFASRAEGAAAAGGPVVLRSAPLALVVVEAPAAPSPQERAEASRAVIAEALAEALEHRLRGPRSAGGYDGMVRAVGKAVEPLLRAERQALARLRAEPRSPDAAADVARVLLACGERDLALVFANHAVSLAAAAPATTAPEAATPAADGAPDPDAPGPPPAHGVDPQGPWLLFARAIAAAPLDGERFLPELQRALAAARTAALPATAWWSTAARASSEYRSTDYSAQRATGAPDVPRAGDHKNAWASKAPDAGEEWLELDFPAAVHAIAVRVVQNLNPGAVVRIEAVAADGTRTALWTGPDRTAYQPGQIGTLVAEFPRSAVPVQRLRIVLDTKIGAGWNEIDAVQLVAAPQ